MTRERENIDASSSSPSPKNGKIFNLWIDIMSEACIGFLSTGIFRLILGLCLPFALIKVHGNGDTFSKTSVVQIGKGKYLVSSLKYEPSTADETSFLSPFKDSCDIESPECLNDKCVRYDANRFRNASSIITMFPFGRLGNMISAYLTLSWLKWEYGLNVYYEKSSLKHMNKFFKHIDMAILEDTFCDWRKFPFKKYEGDIDYLGTKPWRTGKAIQIYLDPSNFMRHEVQGGKRFHRVYRKEANRIFTMRDKYQRYADNVLSEIAKNVTKETISKKPILFIGMHNRRTDYLDFRKRKLGLSPLYQDYFRDAIEYYDDEYGEENELVFIHISDDMKWGEQKLKSEDSRIKFVGCGSPETLDCIGKDFALLKHCNHSIITHGSFGHWTSYLAGGDVYTEYGALIPGSY